MCLFVVSKRSFDKLNPPPEGPRQSLYEKVFSLAKFTYGEIVDFDEGIQIQGQLENYFQGSAALDYVAGAICGSG